MSTSDIFVSIACLSDPDLLSTIHDCIAKATFPEKIRFGVCLQIAEDDEQYKILDQYSPIRTEVVPLQQVRGPIYARSRCESLIDDEEFFLQIDCHSRFFSGWDVILVEELLKAEQINPLSVISHYPLNMRDYDSSDCLDRIGHVNRYRYIGEDAIKSHGSLVNLPERPLPSLGISAAMLFMRSNLRQSFPYDPFLHFGLHAAEQVLYAVRLWTHGVDLFCPTQHSLATDYEGSRDRIPPSVKRLCSRQRQSWPEATWSKVKFLLGLDEKQYVDPAYKESLSESMRLYGIGSVRSLHDYYLFAGIHDKLKTVFPRYAYSHL